jgi:hypothetical protein
MTHDKAMSGHKMSFDTACAELKRHGMAGEPVLTDDGHIRTDVLRAFNPRAPWDADVLKLNSKAILEWLGH